MKEKEKEEAIKQFNKIWKEQKIKSYPVAYIILHGIIEKENENKIKEKIDLVNQGVNYKTAIIGNKQSIEREIEKSKQKAREIRRKYSFLSEETISILIQNTDKIFEKDKELMKEYPH